MEYLVGDLFVLSIYPLSLFITLGRRPLIFFVFTSIMYEFLFAFISRIDRPSMKMLDALECLECLDNAAPSFLKSPNKQ